MLQCPGVFRAFTFTLKMFTLLESKVILNTENKEIKFI
jgi:hypothetical protein